jgi:hypothetical protein
MKKLANELLQIENKIMNTNGAQELEELTTVLAQAVIKTRDEILPKNKIFKNSNNWWAVHSNISRIYHLCNDSNVSIKRLNNRDSNTKTS